jgi:DNA-binding CsgD family transcriptional regulator
MEDTNTSPTSKKKTGPKPKDLITVEVTGYEVGRGITKRVVFDEDVYKLAAMGCTDKEIANWFDIDHNTLKYNFANIIAKGRDDLKQSLRRSQIKLALSGNATMLIWLGKNILGQSDNPVDSEANTPLPWSDDE